MAAPSHVYDLIYSDTTRWNGESPLGAAVTITYSFSQTQSSLTNFPGYTPFTAVEIEAARKALAYIGSLTKITFVETAWASGELVFGNADLTSIGAGGVANTTYNQNGITKASVLVNTQGTGAKSQYQPGSIAMDDIGGYGWQMLLHEIGHALGLKHSHDTNNAGDPNSLLPKTEDNHLYTLMSYVQAPQSTVGVIDEKPSGTMGYSNALKPKTYGLYDIAALQYLYGAPTATANKTYTFDPAKPVFETIYDRGSKSTVDLSAFKAGVTIDMTPGKVNDLPIKQDLPSWVVPAQGAYSGKGALVFAYGSAVAKAIGGAGGDRITGNAANNVLDGGAGNDRLTGGLGDDLYMVGSARDAVVEAAKGGKDTVLSTVSHTLAANVENLTLSGKAVEGTGNASANLIKGSKGANTLNGKAGNDTLSGGKGQDTFVFDTALSSGKTKNVDLIVDFSAKDDRIALDNKIFAGIGKDKTWLDTDFFKDLAKKGAKVDKDDHILYNSKNGSLAYDADGSKTKHSAIQFAQIGEADAKSHATLTAGDFWIV